MLRPDMKKKFKVKRIISWNLESGEKRQWQIKYDIRILLCSVTPFLFYLMLHTLESNPAGRFIPNFEALNSEATAWYYFLVDCGTFCHDLGKIISLVIGQWFPIIIGCRNFHCLVSSFVYESKKKKRPLVANPISTRSRIMYPPIFFYLFPVSQNHS